MRESLTPTEERAGIRQAQREFLDAACEATGMTLSKLANSARVNTSTLTRFYNNPDYQGLLNPKTINRIARVAGTPAPLVALGDLAAQDGFAEDAAPFDTSNGADPQTAAVLALMGQEPGVSPWILNASSISRLGYNAGDILLVDQNATPTAGDAVCAQIYDWRTGTAETIFRLYMPPALIVAASEPLTDIQAEKVHIVDNDRVVIKGVVRDMLRSGNLRH